MATATKQYDKQIGPMPLPNFETEKGPAFATPPSSSGQKIVPTNKPVGSGGSYYSGRGSGYIEPSPSTPSVEELKTEILNKPKTDVQILNEQLAARKEAYKAARLNERTASNVEKFNAIQSYNRMVQQQRQQSQQSTIPQQKITTEQLLQRIKAPQVRQAPKSYTIKNIDWYKTMQGGLPEQNKIRLQDYLEQKYSGATTYLSKEILKLIPEGKIKEALKKEYPVAISATELAKFGLFAPVMATTTETASSIGAVQPKTKTTFLSYIKNEGDISKVKTISATRLGNKKFINVGEDIIVNRNDVGLVAGKDYLINSGKKGGFEIKQYNVFGAVKELGNANYIQKVADNALLKSEAGSGILARTYSKNVAGINTQNQVNFLTGKAIKNIKKIPVKKDIIPETTAGVIKPAGENIYAYLGSNNPVMRVYDTGKRSIVFRNPNILGRIVVNNAEQQEQTGNILTGINTLVSKRVGSQISATKEAVKTATETTAKNVKNTQNIFFSVKKVNPNSLQQINKPSQSLYYGTGQYERTEEEAANIPKVSQKIIFFQPEVEKQIQKPKQLQMENAIEKQKTILDTSQVQNIKQKDRLRLLEKLLTLQKVKQSQRLQLLQRTKQEQRLKLHLSKKPIIPSTFRIPLFSKLQNTGYYDFEPKEKAYNIVFGRGNKAQTLFTKLPKYLAIKKGLDIIRTNIKASFKLEEAGTTFKKDIKPFKLPEMFGPSKREAGRIVEKAKYRLDTLGELRDIFSAKRKRRKISWF